jgi:hypothetical protein
MARIGKNTEFMIRSMGIQNRKKAVEKIPLKNFVGCNGTSNTDPSRKSVGIGFGDHFQM